jgi:hypothetical protein
VSKHWMHLAKCRASLRTMMCSSGLIASISSQISTAKLALPDGRPGSEWTGTRRWGVCSPECLAVQTATGDLQRLATDLERINQRVSKPDASKQVHNKADVDWHERLISNCGNETLYREIRSLRARSRSIDGPLFRGLANAEGSSREHTEIARLISAGDLQAAAKKINEHWVDGIAVVTRWMDEMTEKEVVA